MISNLFEPAAPGGAEAIGALLALGPVRIERIVSHGHSTGWYDQDEDEWVAVLSGEGELEFADGSTRVLRSGDFEFIPRHRRHRVARTSADEPTVWLAVFLS